MGATQIFTSISGALQSGESCDIENKTGVGNYLTLSPHLPVRGRYHVLRGVKIFFLIPPTDENYKRFEAWSKELQEQVFFGTLCPGECSMVRRYPLSSSEVACLCMPGPDNSDSWKYVHDPNGMDSCRVHSRRLSCFWWQLFARVQYRWATKSCPPRITAVRSDAVPFPFLPRAQLVCCFGVSSIDHVDERLSAHDHAVRSEWVVSAPNTTADLGRVASIL